MASLSFDSGAKAYKVNGGEEIVLRPTDVQFLSDLRDTFFRLEKWDEEWRKTLAEKKEEPDAILTGYKDGDAHIRDEIDALIGEGTCAKVFSRVNVLSFADGLPVWLNFLIAVLEEIEPAWIAEQKKTNPRIQKYTAKYRR